MSGLATLRAVFQLLLRSPALLFADEAASNATLNEGCIDDASKALKTPPSSAPHNALAYQCLSPAYCSSKLEDRAREQCPVDVRRDKAKDAIPVDAIPVDAIQVDAIQVDAATMISNRRRGSKSPMPRCSFLAIVIAALCLSCASAHSQISFLSAVDIALRTSPRVRMAEAEVDRARAALAEAEDVYIPTLVASSGLGYSYGYPLGTPTIFSFQAQSLIYSASQHDYIRSTRSSLDAANLSLKDIRQQIAEDTAITYLTLDVSRQRKTAMTEEIMHATSLKTIVRERLDAGQDTEMEFLKARRLVLQLRLQQLQMDGELSTQNDHLSRLLGLTTMQIETVPGSIPDVPAVTSSEITVRDSPAVLAAFTNATAKRQLAIGDTKYTWRPQISFAAQYSRFSTFNNYQLYYPAINNNFNAVGIGVQILLPLFDAVHKAKGRESLAAAASSEQDAFYARQQEAEGRGKRQHAADELRLRLELAGLENELARQQLDAMLVQLNAGTGNSTGPQMTPKDEQNARIQERQKYLDLLDSQFQLRQVEINLLRQNGQLEAWLKSVSAAPQASGSEGTGEIPPAKP